MGNIIGIYLSGTGNTKHCIEKLLSLVDKDAKAVALESSEADEAVRAYDTIYFGYPIQFSNSPMMVRDFIKKHHNEWDGKHVVCIATMGLFSGDGAGCSARLLKKYGAVIDGGIHFRMPDSVCDNKALKKTWEQNHKIVVEADKKIEKVAKGIKNGKYPKEGLNIFSNVLGLLGQRLWFYSKTKNYSNELKIDTSKCTECGKCAQVCPMKNIKMCDGKPVTEGKCTMCYRCISLCPNQAITLLGKEVAEQCRYEKYK